MFRKKLNDNDAKVELEKNYSKAEEILKNDKKFNIFVYALEKKFKHFKFVRQSLEVIPSLIEMLKSYKNKEYTKVPMRSMIAIVSALIYFLSPIDIVPDFIPFLGAVDDIFVLTYVLKFVKKDISNYLVWKEGRKVEL